MVPSHVAILKANKGELEAVRNLDDGTARKVLPLFEIGRLTDTLRERKYIRESSTPTMAHLNRVLDAVGKAWPTRLAMVDGYHWPANARAENGDHVIAYMVARLRALDMSIVPVIGYDRWGNAEYRLALQTIPARDDGQFCLRLDSSAIEDAAEPKHFQDTILDIIDELELDPACCSVLLDFADISMDTMSVEKLLTLADNLIRQLQTFGFHHYAVAGCSLPTTINLAVSNRDFLGAVLRKEILVWQTLRLNFPNVIVVSGDYGVRGPTTTEIRSKYTNGKIRHTVKKQTIVVRGHPFSDDHNYDQMHQLAAIIVKSKHFLGAGFSWGDSQILQCSQLARGLTDTSRWIAIDTNHHLTFVVQEVEEFERYLVEKTVAGAEDR
jgi:hypothetical protein